MDMRMLFHVYLPVPKFVVLKWPRTSNTVYAVLLDRIEYFEDDYQQDKAFSQSKTYLEMCHFRKLWSTKNFSKYSITTHTALNYESPSTLADLCHFVSNKMGVLSALSDHTIQSLFQICCKTESNTWRTMFYLPAIRDAKKRFTFIVAIFAVQHWVSVHTVLYGTAFLAQE